MDPRNAIEAHSISKQFVVRSTTKYGGLAKSGVKQVLNDLSLEVKKGEMLGVVGRNGSGKSTLLKILSGIMRPDAGSLEINGSVAGILELGMGFQPELSGRDNIYIKCEMYGFNDKEIDSFIDEIINFSELREVIDDPLRTYSSGMVAKLAFSVLIHTKCDVLIVDEILSVGDLGFNSKCKKIFEKMKKDGKTIILASHNMSTLEMMCDRIAWLDLGKVREIGDVLHTSYSFQNDLMYSYSTVLQSAESGDVLSQNRLGVMFRDGIGVQVDLEQAKYWFDKAAKAGHNESRLSLAEILLNEGHLESALNLYRILMESGDIVATGRYMAISGGENIVEKQLLTEVRSLAEQGNLRAMKLYADMLFKGTASVRDVKESNAWLEKCTALGDAQSSYELGMRYCDGVGVERDSVKAINYLSKAAEGGIIHAYMNLADIHRRGIGVPINRSEAIKYYSQAAKAGYPDAMKQLGLIYAEGPEAEHNKSLSSEWMHLYSMQQLLIAEKMLADIYRSMIDKECRSDCIRWYEEASKFGLVSATVELANCYKDGICVEADSSKAFELYSSVVDSHSVPSMLELIRMLQRGDGCDRDPVRAYETAVKAVVHGIGRARLQLAEAYLRGIGTTPDCDKARELYRLQSEYGDPLATLMYKSLSME